MMGLQCVLKKIVLVAPRMNELLPSNERPLILLYSATMGSSKLAKQRQRRIKPVPKIDALGATPISPPRPAVITPTAAPTPVLLVEEEHTTETLVAKATPSAFFNAIQEVFSNKKLQRKWINVSQVVEAINNLATMPKTSVERGRYESKLFLSALQKGLGKLFVGCESSDFDCPSAKNYFFVKHKNRDGLHYYVYVDTSADEGKVVPKAIVADKGWREAVDGFKISRFEYLPFELIESNLN